MRGAIVIHLGGISVHADAAGSWPSPVWRLTPEAERPVTRLQTDIPSGRLIIDRDDDPLEYRGAHRRYQSIGGSNPSDPTSRVLRSDSRAQPRCLSIPGTHPRVLQVSKASDSGVVAEVLHIVSTVRSRLSRNISHQSDKTLASISSIAVPSPASWLTTPSRVQPQTTVRPAPPDREEDRR